MATMWPDAGTCEEKPDAMDEFQAVTGARKSLIRWVWASPKPFGPESTGDRPLTPRYVNVFPNHSHKNAVKRLTVSRVLRKDCDNETKR